MTAEGFAGATLLTSPVRGCGTDDPDKIDKTVSEVKDHVKSFEAVLDNDSPDGGWKIYKLNWTTEPVVSEEES